MIEPFLCYIFNTYPEIPTICRKLDDATRRILEGGSINEISQGLRCCVPEVEDFLMTRDGRFLPSELRSTNIRYIDGNQPSFAGWSLPFSGEL